MSSDAAAVLSSEEFDRLAGLADQFNTSTYTRALVTAGQLRQMLEGVPANAVVVLAPDSESVGLSGVGVDGPGKWNFSPLSSDHPPAMRWDLATSAGRGIVVPAQPEPRMEAYEPEPGALLAVVPLPRR